MPNHTDNRVVLSHEDAAQITKICRIMEDGGELCHALIPEPRDENNEPTEGWYDWRIENWGTKWEIYNTFHDRWSDNEVYLSFDSAWSPPGRVFYRLAEMGFEIDAKYLDEGWMYIGWFLQEDGQLMDYTESDIDIACAKYPQLDEEFGISYVREEEEKEEEEEQLRAFIDNVGAIT